MKPAALLPIAVFLCAAARAETLGEAWASALQNDHALAAARLETEAADLDAAAARAQRYPSLTASGGFVQFADAPAFDFSAAGLPLQLPEIVDDDNAAIGSVTAMLPLYTGGRISNSIRAAAHAQRAREAGEAQALQDLKLAVVQSYVDVLRARRALQVAASSVASLDSYVGEVRSMFEREIAPRNDLLAAQVALADAQQNHLRAANAFSIARATYNRRLGQPLDREVELEPTLPSLAGERDAEPVEQLITRALEKRSELAALTAQAQATARLADVERARVRPQLMLSGGYSYLENQALDREEFAMASINVQWPLFDGGVARKRSAALRRMQRAIEQRREDAAALLALEVRRSRFDVEEARSRVRATAEAVAQSEENLRITRQQYQVGLVTSTRVLEAEALRIVSRTNYDNAVLDANLAEYRLARAVGEL